MLKNTLLWIGINLLCFFSLLKISSIITQTNISLNYDFEPFLLLIGFSSTISTIIVCTKIIIDKLNNVKNKASYG